MAELSTIARPYAEALFESVRSDQGGLESWSELLAGLAQLSSHEEVRAALADPRLGAEQRYDLFTGLVKGEMPERDYDLVLDIIRREIGEVGQIGSVGRTFSWSVSNQNRKLQISVMPRGGKTTVRIDEQLGNIAGGVFGGMMGGIGGGLGGAVMGSVA